MLKIGTFAKLSHLPVKTLRYYDDIDLLKPEMIDPFTNYRYYRFEQLVQANRILALKTLGLSLEQIKQLLEEQVTKVEIRRMLQLKAQELQGQQQLVQEQLDLVTTRLRQLELEDIMSTYEIVLKTTDPLLVASKRVHIPTNDQVPHLLGGAFDDVAIYLSQQGINPLPQPSLAIWYSPADSFTDEEAAAAFPLTEPVPRTAEIEVHELPSEFVAAVIHHGHFDDFVQGHAALLKWIAENGYEICGPYREIYHHFCPPDLSNTTTEIQFPVTKK